MNGLNYLLQTNLYLLLFMSFYLLVLRNETFFRQNRFFLNTSVILSFLIPFINSDWFRDLFITQKIRESAIMPSQMLYDTVIVGIDEGASSLSVGDAISWIYTAGATLLLLRFLIRCASLQANLRVEKGSAFSFFNTLVVDKDMPGAETIIDHEKVHMRQWHSADIIFIELAAIVNWFNPVMYLYKKEIRHIHEFIADEEAAKLMQSKSDYAMLLFSNTLGVDPLHLSNNFFNKSLLKRRILMLNQNRSRSTGLWKYGFSAPLFIIMLIVSAATVQSSEVIIKPMTETILSPLPNEASKNIIAALDLDKTGTEDMRSVQELSEARPASSKAGKVVPDFTILKRHFMRTLRYPAFARQNNITGFVVATFTISNKEITGANVIRGLQTDVNGEVLRTLTSFRDQMEVPDDTYTLAIKYSLTGTNSIVPGEFKPSMEMKNYIGQITVTALSPGDASGSGNAVPAGKEEKDPNNSPDNELEDFASIEQLPLFPDGITGWAKYLQANLKYPEEARTARVTGRVITEFVVEKDGSLSDINVVRGLGSGLDEEALRVLTGSPKWKPGILEGRPVRVKYTMPIFFQLAPEKDKRP